MSEKGAEMVNAAGVRYGDLIREYRRRRGLSQEKLGALAGIKKNAVGAWEAGRSRPDVAFIPRLCRTLELPMNIFFGLENVDDVFGINDRFERLNDYNRKIILKQMDMLFELQEEDIASARKIIPLFLNEITAVAGKGSFSKGNVGETIYVASDAMTKKADEVIRVRGDSMEPTFQDGDLALIQHAEKIEEGEIGVFLVGGEGYIREYRADGLYSHNGKYPPMRFAEADAPRCVGRVLGVLRETQMATEEEIAGYRVQAGISRVP